MFTGRRDKCRTERDSCDYSKYIVIRATIGAIKVSIVVIRAGIGVFKASAGAIRKNICDQESFIIKYFHKQNLG